MRYEVRAHDITGDFGVCAGHYRFRWRAERCLRRSLALLAYERKRLDWPGEWTYYIKEIP